MEKQERDELRALAEAATQGTWQECGHERGGCSCCLIWALSADTTVAGTSPGTARRVGLAFHSGNDEDDVPMVGEEQGKKNARFIARASPATFVLLIDEIERLELKLRETEARRSAWRPDWETRTCYGVYDIKNQAWVLDCFDYPSTFPSQEAAEAFRSSCHNYNNDGFEVRPVQ